MAYVVPSYLRPKLEPKIKNNNIVFNKTDIENIKLKFQIGFLKSENKRLKKILKKINKQLN
jgi:hypothetical protein